MFNDFVAAALSEPVEIYGAPRCAPAHRRATARAARREKVRSARALCLPWRLTTNALSHTTTHTPPHTAQRAPRLRACRLRCEESLATLRPAMRHTRAAAAPLHFAFFAALAADT